MTGITLQKKTVLVVEDELSDQFLLQRAFGQINQEEFALHVVKPQKTQYFICRDLNHIKNEQCTPTRFDCSGFKTPWYVRFGIAEMD